MSFPTKPSSNVSGFRLGFGAEASLPQTQSASAVPHDTARLCGLSIYMYRERGGREREREGGSDGSSI